MHKTRHLKRMNIKSMRSQNNDEAMMMMTMTSTMVAVTQKMTKRAPRKLNRGSCQLSMIQYSVLFVGWFIGLIVCLLVDCFLVCLFVCLLV